MASIRSTAPAPMPQRRSIPPLVNGDCLTRDEFEKRYDAMPHIIKAELIEGVVYMPSPVRHRLHSKLHMTLANWLGHYFARTPGLEEYGDNGTVRLDNDNEPQPDLFMMLPVQLGGKAKVDEDDYIAGPPALVCEVSASSVSIDLHLKLNAYRRNGVQEYLVRRTEDAAVDWFSLEAGGFVSLKAEPDGTLHSRVFPGLWLNPASLIAGDLPAIFEFLDSGTATAEHAEFVKKLSAK